MSGGAAGIRPGPLGHPAWPACVLSLFLVCTADMHSVRFEWNPIQSLCLPTTRFAHQLLA